MLTVNNPGNVSFQNQTNRIFRDLQEASMRLATTRRINSSADDAAGMAISNRMDAQISSMKVAVRNVNDGISMAGAAEGGISQMVDILGKMRDIAMSASNGGLLSSDREKLDVTYQQYNEELTRIAEQTSFNGKKILAGDAGTISFQVGANSGDTLDVITKDLSAANSSITNVKTATDASNELGNVDNMLEELNTELANLGAYQNRFKRSSDNLGSMIVSSEQTLSRIRDADMAAESANKAKLDIMLQGSLAMLSMSNMQPQYALSLLGR